MVRLTLAFLVLATALAAAQDTGPEVLNSRKGVITFDVEEQSRVVAYKELWASLDGKIWEPAARLGIRIIKAWSPLKDGRITVGVEFPTDGHYYVYGRFGDGITNRGKLPRDLDEKEQAVKIKYVRVDTGAALKGPMLLQPRDHDKMVAGSRFVLSWETKDEKTFTPNSIALYYRFVGRAWQPVPGGSGRALTGSLVWEVPKNSGEWLSVRVTARDNKDREYPYEVHHIQVRGGELPGRPKLLSPKGGELWQSGNIVKVRWAEGEGDWLRNSTSLSFSMDSGKTWQRINSGLENTGFYLWAPPAQATDRLQMRVGMRMAETGEEVFSIPSDRIYVEVRARGDIAKAMRLYDEARLRHASGQPDAAERLYREALASWPDYPEALHELGRLFYEQKEYARALEFFLRSRAASPSSPFPYVHSAKAEFHLKLYPEAFQDLKDAVALGVDRKQVLALECAELLMQLAVKFAATDRQDLAVDACQHVLRIRYADKEIRKNAQEFLDWVFGSSSEASR